MILCAPNQATINPIAELAQAKQSRSVNFDISPETDQPSSEFGLEIPHTIGFTRLARATKIISLVVSLCAPLQDVPHQQLVRVAPPMVRQQDAHRHVWTITGADGLVLSSIILYPFFRSQMSIQTKKTPSIP